MKRMGIVAVTLAALALETIQRPRNRRPSLRLTARRVGRPGGAAGPPPSSTLPASPPSPVPRPPASSATPPASSFAFGRRPSRDEVSAAREACRQQANTQELSGSERAKFLRSCFAAKMPAVVRRAACRKEAKARGHVQAGLRAYIRQCMARQRGV